MYGGLIDEVNYVLASLITICFFTEARPLLLLVLLLLVLLSWTNYTGNNNNE